MPADNPTENPTENPDHAGTAPIDLATLTPDATPPTDTTPAPSPDEPIGGPATTAATSWAGASDEELDAEPPTE